MKAGLVYLNGGFRAFTGHREIQRGRNTGLVEVRLREPRQSGKPGQRTWAWATVRRIVTKEQIRRYPGESA